MTISTASTVLAYSTTTGQEPIGPMADFAAFEPAPVEPVDVEWPAFCFVCSRVSEHHGEHDDLVEAGLAEYDTENGNVYKVNAHGPEVASVVPLADLGR